MREGSPRLVVTRPPSSAHSRHNRGQTETAKILPFLEQGWATQRTTTRKFLSRCCWFFGRMVCMSMTRRSMVVGGAALAAASRVHGFAQAGDALTAREVVERIKGRVGIPWMTETVDRIVAGSPEVRVKGIATTMMATLEVIQRAVAAGRNMIVTHEPTFWSHLDTTKELEGDPTYEFKRRFIAEHDVAVFRFHDHWHR